jgi:lantibiotic modifying enzyme
MDRAEGEGSATGGAPGRAAVRLADSCLATSLVAMVQADTLDQPFDIGGLRPSAGHMSSLPRRAWHGQRTDLVGFEPERRAERVTAGAPLLDDRPVAPEEHADAVLRGFTAGYRFLAHKRDALVPRLAAFAGRKTRILFRASDQYAALLMVLATPRYQADGLARGIALETLHRVFSRDVERPRLWPLVAEEREDLEGLDIPRFAVPVDATDVVARGGERVVGHFVRSGIDAVAERLRRLSEDDLAAEQALLASCLQPSPAPPALPSSSSGDARLVAAAEALGGAVREAPAGLRRGPGGDAGEGMSLYDGAAGRAVFFAALASVAGAEWTRDARQAAGELGAALGAGPAAWSGIGGLTGFGSAAYALALAQQLLGDPSLALPARRFALAFDARRLAHEERADVESGLAGLALGVLALHATTPDPALVALAQAAGRRLLALQIADGPEAGAWRGEDGRVHTGFAHGASGIALALARIHAVAPDPALKDAVAKALFHARASYSPAEKNWPLARRLGGTLPMVAWCHGAPGIALARVQLPGELLDTTAREDLKTAIETTATTPAGRFDHLCCGRLGRAEVLLVSGARLKNDGLVTAARALTDPVAERVLALGRLGARTAGFEWRVTLPGFFEGLAGIGYTLLRCAAPRRLPSVIGFEFPRGGDE